MRRPNPRLAKIHRNYTVEEIAFLYGGHKNTVRQWVKKGLPVLDKHRPMLIHGKDLRRFLEERRSKNKKRLKPGEIYCVKCREPRLPEDLKVEYQSLSDTQGSLIGICPNCKIRIYRRVSLIKFASVRGDLSITMPQGWKHIEERE